MVGPWGLEPQTSTVSILKLVIARKGMVMLKGIVRHGFTRIFTAVRACCILGHFPAFATPLRHNLRHKMTVTLPVLKGLSHLLPCVASWANCGLPQAIL